MVWDKGEWGTARARFRYTRPSAWTGMVANIFHYRRISRVGLVETWMRHRVDRCVLYPPTVLLVGGRNCAQSFVKNTAENMNGVLDCS